MTYSSAGPRSPRSSCWGQRRDLDSFCGPGVHPQKPPKNPRPGDAEGGSPSSMLSGGSPTSTAPEEPSRQEPGLAVSSFLEGEPAAASFPGPLEKETALLSASQFARPRKSVGRKAERRVEDLESKAVSPEAMHSPGAPELEGSPGPGAQMPADSSQPTWSGWKPGSPVSEEGAAAYSPKTAGQDPEKEQGASVLDSGDRGSPVPEGAQGLGGPEGQLPCSGAEGTKLDHGDTQEAGALPGTLGGGVGISSNPVPTPSLATLCMKAWASTPRGAGGQAGAPLGTTVTADTGTDATRTDPGALGMAQPPACPREQTPPGCRSVCEETPGGQGEAGPEEQPPRDSPGSPTVLQAAVPGNPEPAVDAQDPAPDLGPSSDHTQAPGPAVEWAGTAQLEDRWAVESDGQHLGGSCVGSSAATKGPFQEARVCQGGLEAPTPPPDPCQHPLDLADQAGWPETLAMELDFLPDSQLQAALDAPGLETPAEQEHPAGNESVLCWPSLGTSRGDRVPETEAQPRMEDASDTVRGLIVELSNLNRLIMSAHRDLETFRRLGPRKARPASCPAKAAMAHDERPRRDL